MSREPFQIQAQNLTRSFKYLKTSFSQCVLSVRKKNIKRPSYAPSVRKMCVCVCICAAHKHVKCVYGKNATPRLG